MDFTSANRWMYKQGSIAEALMQSSVDKRRYVRPSAYTFTERMSLKVDSRIKRTING
jgi:hypothetical protein